MTRKNPYCSEAGLSPCEGCPVLLHSSASQKKEELERLIFLKLSSRPHNQPVCSHQPHTGLRQQQKKISQNIYRRAPTESHRTVDDFQAPDRRCVRSLTATLTSLPSARGRREGGKESNIKVGLSYYHMELTRKGFK